jgi:hypothetical protein
MTIRKATICFWLFGTLSLVGCWQSMEDHVAGTWTRYEGDPLRLIFAPDGSCSMTEGDEVVVSEGCSWTATEKTLTVAEERGDTLEFEIISVEDRVLNLRMPSGDAEVLERVGG